MIEIPKWLIQVHNRNFYALLNCINNPSIDENNLSIEMYKTLLQKDSGFSDFKYIILNEWYVDRKNPHLGKGDLAFTNGKNILVVEVKRIKGFNKQEKLVRLTKVIRQARYYALMIKKLLQRKAFPIPEYNQYFNKSKIHAAFYTNLSNNIILVKHSKRISSSAKKRLIDLPSNLTTQEVINTNQLNVELVDEQTPIKMKNLINQVKIEENCASRQNNKYDKENSSEEMYLIKQSKFTTMEQPKEQEVILINNKQNQPKTPQKKQKEKNKQKYDDVIKIKTDSKNRKFLVDPTQILQSGAKKSQNENQSTSKKQIEQASKPNAEDNTLKGNNNQNQIKNDIIFLNEIKPYKQQKPDLILLNSIKHQIEIPIQSNSPKILPFNMTLALQNNLDINCTLSQLSAPNKVIKNEVEENEECDFSYCSFIELASQELDNSYLHAINDNYDLTNRQYKQTSNIFGTCSNLLQLNPSLLQIQKLFDNNENSETNNQQIKKDKVLTQLDKIILDKTEIIDLEKESQYKNKNNQNIQNNLNDQVFIIEEDKKYFKSQELKNIQNCDKVIEIISELKTNNLPKQNNLKNSQQPILIYDQSNQQKKESTKIDTIEIKIIEQTKENQQEAEKQNENEKQMNNFETHNLNGSFYNFMLEQISVQEHIQELYTEQQMKENQIKMQQETLINQKQNIHKIDDNWLNQSLYNLENENLEINKQQDENTFNKNLNLENNSNNPTQQLIKKIIIINKQKFQSKLNDSNNDKIITQIQNKPNSIITHTQIQDKKIITTYNQVSISPDSYINQSENKIQIDENNFQNSNISKNIDNINNSQQLINKSIKKFKIVKSNELFKGKKINIVHKQLCRQKKFNFIETN